MSWHRYNRVKIIEKSSNGYVEVLFVDKAEFLDIKLHLLLTIHPDLITYLPFQVNINNLVKYRLISFKLKHSLFRKYSCFLKYFFVFF